MKVLVLPIEEEEFPDDIDRMISVCKESGYTINRFVATTAWKWYSRNYAAGWMLLPEKDIGVLNTILRYTVVYDEW